MAIGRGLVGDCRVRCRVSRSGVNVDRRGAVVQASREIVFAVSERNGVNAVSRSIMISLESHNSFLRCLSGIVEPGLLILNAILILALVDFHMLRGFSFLVFSAVLAETAARVT